MRLNERYWNGLIAISHTFSVFEFKLPPLWSSKKYYNSKIESPYPNTNTKLENTSKSIFLIKVNNKINSKNETL